MDVRIWFNGIWPDRMHLIPMLRENPDHADVRIFGTHTNPAAPALRACDVAGIEPAASGRDGDGDDEFFGFALDFCRRHGIDVVMPSARLAAFADHAAAFARIGTKVMCSPAATARLVTSKSRTYAAAEDARVPLAPWRVIADADGLRNAVAEMARTGVRLCLKPAGEYSANGFRVLDDAPLEVSDLELPPQPRVSVADAADALRRAEKRGEPARPFIVMPYLDPPEISVDCLSDAVGRLVTAIPRAKEGKVRTMLDAPELTALARRVVAHFGLAYLSNVQFRHWNGRPVLLEANARASAGLYQTALTEVNLAWAAVRMLRYGDSGELPPPRSGGRLVVVHHAIPISGLRQPVAPAVADS
ncbi:ATP-grasp domain-containing protein [Streptomyces halobius]|uniref:ATP-grasp domain-containing protein n=1 Tax=Streptomyces halobius TaxID=2879846 RepID=A0ABY4MEK6_9ACTN|nr:ATP-grasp domain-containing protein [Streptomyces halobius]UQA95928.1 ATP-grasp domain-containing protein [Streptomyces halobius]